MLHYAAGHSCVPEQRAAFLIENYEPLVAIHHAAAGRLLVVEREDAAAGNGGPGEAATHGRPPFHDQAVVRATLDETGVAPHRVPLDAAPLRPVLGGERDRRQTDDGANGNGHPARGMTVRHRLLHGSDETTSTPGTRSKCLRLRVTSEAASPFLTRNKSAESYHPWSMSMSS